MIFAIIEESTGGDSTDEVGGCEGKNDRVCDVGEGRAFDGRSRKAKRRLVIGWMDIAPVKRYMILKRFATNTLLSVVNSGPRSILKIFGFRILRKNYCASCAKNVEIQAYLPTASEGGGSKVTYRQGAKSTCRGKAGMKGGMSRWFAKGL